MNLLHCENNYCNFYSESELESNLKVRSNLMAKIGVSFPLSLGVSVRAQVKVRMANYEFQGKNALIYISGVL